MIDMASRETRKQAKKREGKQARKQTEGTSFFQQSYELLNSDFIIYVLYEKF